LVDSGKRGERFGEINVGDAAMFIEVQSGEEGVVEGLIELKRAS